MFITRYQTTQLELSKHYIANFVLCVKMFYNCQRLLLSLQVKMIRAALKRERMNFVTVLRALELPGYNYIKFC